MSKTRELHWTPPPTEKCPICNGTRKYTGLFSSAPCYHCDGSGFVQLNGEPFPPSEVIAIQGEMLDVGRKRYRKLLNLYRKLKEIPAVKKWLEERAHGYGTNKHHGD